jgi:glucose/arabinose dehydrogenase
MIPRSGRSRPARAWRLTGLVGVTCLSLVVAACGAPTPSPTPVPPPSASPSPSVRPSTAASGGASSSPSPDAAPSPAPATPAAGDPSAVRLDLAPVVGGLEAPVFVAGAGDGSGRLFVVEQPGRIRIVRDGKLAQRPFLDISDRVGCCGERGLLGLAFPPGGGTAFFVDYTDRDGSTVVSRFQVSDDPDLAEPTSESIVLRIPQPYANHNGGMIAFGPDGDLYIGMGDGGSGGDPHGNGQDLSVRLGKLLRIDVRASMGEPYVVPSDNPFVGIDGSAPEIWALGLRNPWRFSFDRVTGDLWIGDVGQGAWEEVDRARAADGGGRGANFGWNRMEGSHCYPSGKTCALPGLALPIAEYGHDQGCAVTGGYVYRGTAQPALVGVYVYGDYCSGRLWGLASGGPDSQKPVLLAETGRMISSFGQDDTGELYVADLAAGEILRLVARPD